MDPLPARPSRKSLTPQRKHHKLLKDGSEVWSADVEKIFVDGLHKYWESPWATYSRGRSRWRNQFLVEHLKKHGIERSKKQVASHIQVLRNMWRGEPGSSPPSYLIPIASWLTRRPEFHLVAGGEELFQENGLLASPKSSAGTDSPEPFSANLDNPDWRNSWSSSASSSAPDFSTFDPQLNSRPPSAMFSPPASMPMPSLPILPDMTCTTMSSATVRGRGRSAVKLEPLALEPTLFNLPQASHPESPDFPFLHAPNRLSHIDLWADTPLSTVDVDQLTAAPMVSPAYNQPAQPYRIMLHYRVKLPAGENFGLQTWQGVHGAVTFASRWTTAQCHTKAWAGKLCVMHEVGVLEPFNAQQPSSSANTIDMVPPMPMACLPESALSQCRWLEPSTYAASGVLAGQCRPHADHVYSFPDVQTVTQQFVVDKEVLAVTSYTLDRTADPASAPSVELVGFHKVSWQTPPSQPQPSPSASPLTPHLFPTVYSAPLAPQPPSSMRVPGTGEDAPLACALDFTRGPSMHGSDPARHVPHYY
ncbi:uncharacterized protein FIBRA_01147 [Fibroporia radiculosa]|uniref:TEA domain-containing protein n=1 Tax=Fibroporia radiculosa TaxID=599839 RepID=J4G0T9_9APHY|nr:uncharacterized protein FIBRA_01147 [Fibroporia radiculosa]CCL99133.1 predicted protein [Fibroporia radiculosa]